MRAETQAVYRAYARRLRRANLCIRCCVNEPKRNTLHCEGCLDYFNRKYVPKSNGKGRKTVARLERAA